jgi:hypothetical protein
VLSLFNIHSTTVTDLAILIYANLFLSAANGIKHTPQPANTIIKPLVSLNYNCDVALNAKWRCNSATLLVRKQLSTVKDN